MTYLQSIILGFVQGVAEFLPISSSGHLSILQNVFGLASTEAEHLFFDVLLHLGTLLAVFVAYWGEIKALILEFFTMLHLRRLPAGQKPDRLSRRTIAFIIIGTLPLLVVLPVKDAVDSLYNNLLFIGCALLVTGLLLFLADRMGRGAKDAKTASIADILIVGFAGVGGGSRSVPFRHHHCCRPVPWLQQRVCCEIFVFPVNSRRSRRKYSFVDRCRSGRY